MRFEDYRTFKTALGGDLLQLEIGKVCEMANGQVMVRYGDTVVNVTAVASKEPRPDISFFPLTCDYEEKMYAAGKIPGGFIKREGRPSEKAVLTSRLMDRPLRPLFPEGFRNDVQVVALVLSVDLDSSPEIAALIGSSVALAISDIPWAGPTAAVAVGRVDGRFIINPNLEQRENSDLHLTVAGTKDAIMMVEAHAQEVPEEDILDAILFGHEEIQKIVAFIEMIVEEVGKPKMDFPLKTIPADVDSAVRAFAENNMREAIKTFDKQERDERMDAVEKETLEHFAEIYPDQEDDIADVLDDIAKDQVRSLILDEGVRPDHRRSDEIRPIWCETGLLPRTHGSGLFTRGQTQALSVVTLGTISDAQTLDGISEDTEKRYMHNYNFPPYSVGETRPIRGPGRREIGHGALAEKALLPVLPEVEEFPYAIRVVSEILSSNGSTSQAAVCGSTLALMDAGVPIKAPVAGIAMGLIARVGEEGKEDKMVILSDIQGMEDFLGDMDFKVAGTAEGITAIQMDIKVHGLSRDVLRDALAQAKKGRMHIIDQMLDEIKEPREELSPYAPRIISMYVDVDKIRIVIGPGGKTINKIIADTGAQIDIDDDGLIYIGAPDLEGANEAMRQIELLTKDVEVGEIYTGKVVRIMTFGAFIELLPGKDGLLHISKIDRKRIDKVEDVLNLGDTVTVRVDEIDAQDRINLSRRGLEDEPIIKA